MVRDCTSPWHHVEQKAQKTLRRQETRHRHDVSILETNFSLLDLMYA